MKKAWDMFVHWIIYIFGRWSWTPPQWISLVWKKFSNTSVGRAIDQKWKVVRRHPRQMVKWGGAGVGLIAAVSIIGYFVQQYYAGLPQPDYVSVHVETPALTSVYEKKVQGLQLRFAKSAAPLHMIGKDVTDEVSISPKIKGKWRWSSDKTLEFTPEGAEAFKTDWLVGTEYEISLRKKMLASQIILREYTIKFTTAALSLYTAKREFYIDPKNEKIKRVIFNISASTPVDAEDFKKRISLKMQPKDDSLLGKTASSLKYKITFNEHHNQAFIESENITLPENNHVAKLVIDKGVKSRRGGEGSQAGLSEELDIPGLYEAMRIEDPKIIFARNEKYEPEQALVFGTVIDVRPEALEKNISLELLPADYEDPVTKKKYKNYQWSSAAEVTGKVREQLQPVKWTLLPGVHPQNSQHSLRIEAPVHRYMLFSVEQGVQGIGGYKLKHSFHTILRVPDYTPELLFMSEGSILTLTGDRKLPVLSRNVRKIKYELGRVLPSHSNILIAKLAESAKFSKPHLYSDIEDSIMERFEEKVSVNVTSRAATNYSSLDVNNYIQGVRGFYYVKAYRLQGSSDNSSIALNAISRENISDLSDIDGCDEQEGCGVDDHGSGEGYAEEQEVQSTEEGYYHLTDRRLIMITDLGIIAKTTSTNKTILFVQNLATGHPVSDATISVLGVNGISILETRTDGSGRAEISDLSSYNREKRPIAFMARKNDDFAYLPYNMSERQLSFSRFDVGGEHDESSADAINAMLFSDRELYRPGETANIGILLRSQAQGKSRELPFKITITDPRGQQVKSESINAALFGIKDYQFKTTETSPTGSYTISLSTAPKKGSKEYSVHVGSVVIRVEEFVPDKLRITAQMDPGKAVGWVSLDKTKFHVSLNNLFGSPAENRVVKPELTLVPTSPQIQKFKSYSFINPNSNDAKTATEFLSETKTDTKGAAVFDVDLSKYKGFYSVRFSVQGFEAEGGRSVSAVAGGYASHLKHLVGYKADGSLSYISKGSERSVELVAVNSAFEQASADVTAQLMFNEFVSSLVKQNDGTYKYQSVKKEKLQKTDKWKIGTKGFKMSLPTDSPGLYTYLISDADGNEVNRFEFNVIGDVNLTRALDRNAELQLTLSKDDFSAGEEIEINILAPYAGAGLITIERDTVYTQKWFQMSTNSSTQKIKIPEGFTGNGYINITLLRAKTSKEIYMSPLSYGVIPFTVNADQVKTTISLSSPEKVKPGESLKITYSSNKPTSMILYGVDEGIVSAARYKLPDPIRHYFKKKALQVNTYQLLDLVLPEYSLLKQSYAPGGDGMGQDMFGANLNPFKRKTLKPVVFWSGVVQADTSKKTFEYKVPDYFNGSIKIYAVANSEKGIGSSTHQTIARADFVISPTPPLFVSPSDEFEVGVLVSNQSEGKGQKEELEVAVKSTEHVMVTSVPKMTLTIPQGREMGTSFRFRATETLGSADIIFSATNGTLSSSLEQSLSVRPAMPYITDVVFEMTTKANVELPLSRVMYDNYAKNYLTVSASPIALAKGLSLYLGEYQFLCTEQLLSMAIPYVFLPESKRKGADAEDQHLKAISTLRTRQTPDGGFALYGGELTDTSVTLYAGLYLVEAKDRGLSVPADMLERVRRFVSSDSVQQVDSLQGVRQFAQALYLQARLGLVPGNKLNFLREKVEKDFKDVWKNDITAIWLAGTYALVQKQDAGWSILKNVDMQIEVDSDMESFYDNNVRRATLIHVAATQFPDKITQFINAETLGALTKDLVGGNYNTHSAARLIMAFGSYQKYAAQKGFPGGIQIFEKLDAAEKEIQRGAETDLLNFTVNPKSTQVAIRNSPVTPYFYSMSVSGFDKKPFTEEVKKGIEAHRTLSANAVNLGDELEVSVKVRSTKDKNIPHVVVVDLFPAGFELILNSLEKTGVEYVDKREDRVVIYLNASQEMAEVKYRLKAVNKGKFALAPLYAEAMYNKGIQYRGVSHGIEIQ